jgi:hypothetical protein
MVTTPLGNAINFLKELGFFDVVLPFLLVFTIVFAILEKTRILGTMKVSDGTDVANKNLNSVVAFVIGLLVNFSPSTVLVILIVLAVVLIIDRSYRRGRPNRTTDKKRPSPVKPIPIEATIRGSILSESLPARGEKIACTTGWDIKTRPAI